MQKKRQGEVGVGNDDSASGSFFWDFRSGQRLVYCSELIVYFHFLGTQRKEERREEESVGEQVHDRGVEWSCLKYLPHTGD
jgi:hypothetical protein